MTPEIWLAVGTVSVVKSQGNATIPEMENASQVFS